MSTKELESNLAGLACRASKAFMKSIQLARPSERVCARRARNGELVPVMSGSEGDIWLHSRYSPANEASRAVKDVAPSQLLAVAGLGNGAHVRALLESCRPHSVIVVSEPPDVLARILSEIEFETILSDERVRIVTAEEATYELRAAFIPLITGGLGSVILRGIDRALPELSEACNRAVKEVADLLSGDITAQTRYGLLWMRNLILNFPTAASRDFSLELPSRLTIAGAGPGLESWIDDGRTGEPILATDTAAPALEAHGVRPVAIVSVDPAVYSYHHLLCGARTDVPWMVDVAACPIIWRTVETAVPIAGEHPLLRLLRGDNALPWPAFRGSDVTQAAISVSQALGAAQIATAGADYAYPYEKSYVRGSYVDTLFEQRATRLSGAITLEYQFCYRSPQARRDSDGRVRTPELDAARLATFELKQRPANRPSPGRMHPGLPPGERWAIDRLGSIATQLTGLPSPGPQSSTEYYLSLSRHERALLAGCIPSALAFSHRHSLAWHEALETAVRRFCRLVSAVYPKMP